MCYFLYGAVNEGINQKDYEEVSQGIYYHFNIGTKHNVKMAVLKNADDFRIIKGCCDYGILFSYIHRFSQKYVIIWLKL